jgi:hypothetical protein
MEGNGHLGQMACQESLQKGLVAVFNSPPHQSVQEQWSLAQEMLPAPPQPDWLRV